MPRHASNADRIARAAAEAEARTAEKAAKKRAPRKPSSRSRAAAAARPKGRQKVVWAVGRPGLEPVKTFAYPEREAADAEARKRGGDYRVVDLKVPME